MANVNKPANDAKKVALNLYFKMFQSMQDVKLKALEIPIEFLDKEIFGDPANPDDGLVDKLYNKLFEIINVKPDTRPDPEPEQGSELEEIKDDFANMDIPDVGPEVNKEEDKYELGNDTDELMEM